MSVGDAILQRLRRVAEGSEVLEECAARFGAGGHLVLVQERCADPEVVEPGACLEARAMGPGG